MERCGAPGVKSNIEDVEWIRPQIHATPIQIDHWHVHAVYFVDSHMLHLRTARCSRLAAASTTPSTWAACAQKAPL